MSSSPSPPRPSSRSHRLGGNQLERTPTSSKNSPPQTSTSAISSDSHDVNCPLCGLPVPIADLDSHYHMEIQRIAADDAVRWTGARSATSYPSSLSSSPVGSPKVVVDDLPSKRPSKRRSAAIAAEQLISTKKSRTTAAATPVEPIQQLLVRIRANRVKRSISTPNAASDSSTRRRRHPIDETADLVSEQQSLCFMCGARLPEDSAAMNAHIDDCLSRQQTSLQPETSSSPRFGRPVGRSGRKPTRTTSPPPAADSFEEYTWAGQTRVRLTSMLEGSFEANGFIVHKKTDRDTEDDVNVDDDDEEQFGSSQYNERDIQRRELGSVEESPVGAAAAPLPAKDEDEWIDLERVDPRQDFLDFLKTVPPDTRLVMEALVARIRVLESSRATLQKCLICLDPYKNPVTSITCWHVHCEQCWLDSLAAKRLCPQCQRITGPSDLRRVFL
ncbi:hypothetical protein DFJ73DRAFT_812228 [Zopfochytrium polystomum]|nr:hypothetical protein DFJ73DRAFT_812228 [Zopfochytrium polystomum]